MHAGTQTGNFLHHNYTLYTSIIKMNRVSPLPQKDINFLGEAQKSQVE